MAIKVSSNLDLQNASKIINTPTPVSAGDAVNKSYVDGLVSTTLKPPIAFDASTNPNYPSSSAGDTYLVTVAGRIGGASGKPINEGDLIVCQISNIGGDEASAGINFFVVESNRDQATEITKGVARLATQAEVNSGLNTETIVTPSTLQTKIINELNSSSYVTTIGNGSSSSFSITHSLNSSSVQVVIRETSLPGQYILADVSVIDVNNISVSFTNPPTVNQFTVIIRK